MTRATTAADDGAARHTEHHRFPAAWAALGVGGAAGLGASVLTAAFEPFFVHNLFILFLAAILGSGLWGGFRGGAAATAISSLGLVYGLYEPVGELAVALPADRVRLVILVVLGLLISGLSHALQSARHRAADRDRSLRESEESYRALFSHTAEALYIVGGDGRVLEANAAAGAMFGCPRDQLIGRTPAELSATPLADDGPLPGRLALAFEGQPQRFEWRGRRLSGATFPLELVLGRARYFGNDVVIAAARDLTDQRRLEEQLRQSQKMEAVGRLAGGVAHDFNNILTSIHGHAALLDERLPPGDPLRDDVEEIERAAGLATEVTRQLLSFSRKRDADGTREAAVGPLIEGMERMLRRIIGEDVSVGLELSAGLGRVRMDPGQLEQILLNLVVNARHAMPDGGAITITAHPHTLEPGDGDGGLARPAVRLSVADTGTGMDPATAARVFEPFFTTKRHGQGTGLGLSTVYAIVQQNGGQISLDTRPGEGTVFHIDLPMADPRVPGGDVTPAAGHASADAVDRDPTAAASEGPASGDAAARGAGSETILVVEDEASVRALVRRVLERAGYRVLEAGTAGEALVLGARNGNGGNGGNGGRGAGGAGAVDLLLTDLGLPDLGGAELAARLRQATPELPVLFSSGYGRDDAAALDGVRGPVRFLQKPFAPGDLLGAVRAALDDGA